MRRERRRSRDDRDDDQPTRRRQYRRSGGGGFILAFLGVLTVLAGIGYVFRGEILKLIEGEGKPGKPGKPTQTNLASQKTARSPDAGTKSVKATRSKRSPAPGIEKPPPDVTKVTPRSERDNTKADKLLRRARTAYEKLQFDQAAHLYEEALALNCSRDRREKARAGRKKMRLSENLFDGVRLAYEAQSDGVMVRIRTIDGKEKVGAVDDLAADPVRFHQGRISYPIPRVQIREIKRLSADERLAELQASYRRNIRSIEIEIKSQIKIDGAVGHVLQAREAFKFQLGREVAQHLDRAFRLEPELRQAVESYEARKLLKEAIWRDSFGSEIHARRLCRKVIEKYGHTNFKLEAEELLTQLDANKKVQNYKRTFTLVEVKPARPTQPRDPPPGPQISSAEEPPQESTQETDTIKGSAEVARANKIFEKAAKLYNEAMQAQSSSRNEKLKQVEKKCVQCLAIYERELKKDPENSALESRLTDANKLRFWSRRLQTL